MGNNRSLVAFCRERPTHRGGRLQSSTNPAGNIRHMAQLRTHETALAVSNSFSVDWIFPRVPFIRSVRPKRDGAITVCEIEVRGIKRIRHVTSCLQDIWDYCKIIQSCEERKKAEKIEKKRDIGRF